jgi:hypothetical protein
MPLLVAAPGITASRVQRLRAHLVRVHEQRDYEALLAAVLLERFVEPDMAAYHRLDAMARFAADRGFEIIR